MSNFSDNSYMNGGAGGRVSVDTGKMGEMQNAFNSIVNFINENKETVMTAIKDLQNDSNWSGSDIAGSRDDLAKIEESINVIANNSKSCNDFLASKISDFNQVNYRA